MTGTISVDDLVGGVVGHEACDEDVDTVCCSDEGWTVRQVQFKIGQDGGCLTWYQSKYSFPLHPPEILHIEYECSLPIPESIDAEHSYGTMEQRIPLLKRRHADVVFELGSNEHWMLAWREAVRIQGLLCGGHREKLVWLNRVGH